MIIEDETAMIAFGERLGASLAQGDWVSIDGPLGAGKTVLSKGIIKALGYTGEVASPSYALVHHYDPPDVKIAVAHADLYRLNHADELDELGLAEDQDERIILVEWAMRGRAGYGHPTHAITIEPRADGSRIVKLKIGDNDVEY